MSRFTVEVPFDDWMGATTFARDLGRRGYSCHLLEGPLREYIRPEKYAAPGPHCCQKCGREVCMLSLGLCEACFLGSLAAAAARGEEGP